MSATPTITLEVDPTNSTTIDGNAGLPWATIITAVLVFGAAFIAFLISRANKKPAIVKNKGNTVFVMGECGAGKTALLYQLALGTVHSTASSIEPTQTVVKVQLSQDEEKKISFIDVPGHNYSKVKYTNELAAARGIIFMVDSSNLNEYGNAVDYLYNLMIQKVFAEKEIPMLLCANKADLPKSLRAKDFEHLLVREIEKVKKSKRAIQEEENDLVEDYLKHQNSEFTFQNNPQFTVCETSVINGQIEPVKQFLTQIFA